MNVCTFRANLKFIMHTQITIIPAQAVVPVPQVVYSSPQVYGHTNQ